MLLCLAASPGPGPMWAQRPARHARPCCHPCPLSASPAQACSTPPAALLPASPVPGNMPISLLHPALAVVHCAGVQAREAEGLQGPAWTEISVSAHLRALGRLPPGPTWPQPPLTGGFRGGIFVCLFLCRGKKKPFSFVEGWLCLGFVIFLVWFGFHFSRGVSRRISIHLHLSFSCSLLLHRCHTLAVLTSPIPPYNKVCTRPTPSSQSGPPLS